MNIKLYKDDNLRIYGDHNQNNFIDVKSVGYESLSVDFFSSFVYIEIRKKESKLRVFTFNKKSHKKECDFGWWEDAEVVYALNNTKGEL